MNNPPFAIGQKVVCLKSSCEFVKGRTYTVDYIFQCPGCKTWHITLVEAPDYGHVDYYCCGRRGIDIPSDCAGGPVKYFAPIESTYSDATEEILNKFKQVDECPDKIIIKETENV